jgi:hypothetical protein
VSKQPIAELFGFPPASDTEEAQRYRRNRLCPYNNKVPSCTKDSVIDPLGVCTIFHGNDLAVICPVRLRQEWIIADQAAEFFFAKGTQWTTLVEVRLKDKDGKSAGNIDVVLVAYDERGVVTDFGTLEVKTVYISGNLRRTFFKPLMENREEYLNLDWEQSRKKNPGPDYLSSSRKRLAPQLIFKGGVMDKLKKKTAIAIDQCFFDTLPIPVEVPKKQAEIAWLIYGLEASRNTEEAFHMVHRQTIYTRRPDNLHGSELLQDISEEEVLCQLESEFERVVV